MGDLRGIDRPGLMSERISRAALEDDVRRKAVNTVLANSQNNEDALALLAMLGLVDVSRQTGKWEFISNQDYPELAPSHHPPGNKPQTSQYGRR